MIDTIFYFCPTLELYEQTLTENGGEGISSRTITFVEDVREIYFNGRGYGKTSTAGLITDDQFETWKNTILVRLNLIISDAENDLQDLQTLLSTEIQDAISQALQDQNGRSIWTKITETDEGVSAVTTLISDLSDRLDNISTNGDIQYSAVLQSVIDEGIRNNTAFTNLQSRWAVLNENQAVLEWMASGFKSQVNENTNFATVFSAYLNEVDSNLSTIAALQTKANANEAKLNAIANWNGYVEGLPVSYYGGLVTASNMDGAIAALIANSNTDTSAAITANVTRNTSNITLSADKIYLDADTTLANTIQATQGSIGGFTISQNSLSAELGDYRIELTPLHFATYNSNVLTNEIKSNGSGSIASGGISWTNDGTITLSQEFLRSLFNELHKGAVNLDVYGGINEEFTIYKSMSYNPTRIEIVSNFDTLYLESHLFDTSCGLTNNVARSKGLEIRELLDAILSDYPINGTVEEKRDWYFKRYDIIGSFQSGILVGKKYVDPETQLEKDLLSELHMDHKVNMNNFSILENIASTNSLDINKFVGYAEEGPSASNSPYLVDFTKTYIHPIRASISSAPQAYSGSITDAYNNGVYFAYVDSIASAADVCIIPQNTNVIFQYNNSSTYPDVFGNPVEGSWGIIKGFAVYYDSDGNTNHGFWYAPSVLYSGSGSYSSSSVMYAGAIVRYTSGNWILTGAIMPKVTSTQYRANESE